MKWKRAVVALALIMVIGGGSDALSIEATTMPLMNNSEAIYDTVEMVTADGFGTLPYYGGQLCCQYGA